MEFLGAILFAFVLGLWLLDIFYDTLYYEIGSRVLSTLSRGRFPPEHPSFFQRVATTTTGLSVIVLFLSLLVLAAKLSTQ